jgi:hypothetical protein
MRALLTPPDAILDPVTHAPRVGSYRGGLPRIDLRPLAPGALARLLQLKRWTYVALVSDEVFIAVAVVRLGYVANTFAFVFEKATGRMLVDRSRSTARSRATITHTASWRAARRGGGGSRWGARRAASGSG